MILVVFICSLLLILYVELQKEPFQNKNTTILSTVMNTSPASIVEGLHKRIHPYIPYKHHYYKLKRYLRYK